MKTKIILVAVLGALLGGGGMLMSQNHLQSATTGKKILYYTCPMHSSVKSDKPGSCPICGMGLQPVYGNDIPTNTPPSNATNNSAADTKPKPYPFDTCLVDGMKLGSMGEPYVFTYQGQEIKFCCSGCLPQFKSNPAKYLKKIQDAEAAPKK